MTTASAEARIKAKKAELVAVSERIRQHDADFDARRAILVWLIDHGVSKAECARLAGVVPMAINYALDDKRKKKAAHTK